MRFVCLSDTHLRHNFKVPEGDVLLHAGDATWKGNESELVKFIGWFASHPHKHKVFVAGNHDWGFQEDRAKWEEALKHGGITYLQDSGVTIDGFKIWGSPWQPEFCNWAFNLPRHTTELRGRWALIPDDTDVLITHGPPKGILDRTNGRYDAPENVGCYDLRERVSNLHRLKLHVFGHIHCAYGSDTRALREGGQVVRFVNASVCDENYDPTNPVQVVEIAP